MGRLESISSKKPLDWDVEKDGIKEMKSNNYSKDSFDLLFTPEELKSLQASVPIIDEDDKASYEDSIDQQFKISADEFHRIVKNEGKDIEYTTSPEIEAIKAQMEMDREILNISQKFLRFWPIFF